MPPNRELPPPYFAFKTLTNTITKMEEVGPPNRIDRYFLSGMSGAGQTQFIAGLKSLGLIDENTAVQPPFVEIVSKPGQRPALIGQLLHERYPEAVELGKTNATTGELLEVFQQYGVQGDTARKAIAFYLKAAEYAGDIPLSPNFKTPSARPSGNGSKRRPKKAQNQDAPATPIVNDGIPSGLHPALAGLLKTIPKEGQTWTQLEYERFNAAFEPVLAIAAPVSDEQTSDPDNGDGDLD
ncbi:MAG TPA: hypothetical protein VMS60_00575 [Solirubrobacterales bacterium]|nr:hypothetical protein [Solirubrobacterales bacterium]